MKFRVFFLFIVLLLGVSAPLPLWVEKIEHNDLAGLSVGDPHIQYITESEHTGLTHFHGTLSGLLNDDHTQYLKESDYVAGHTNGTNCSAGQYPLGVDASGNVESCTAAGVGNVTGAASSTDNAFARMDSTTGKVIQNSVYIGNDLGDVTGFRSLDISSLTAEKALYADSGKAITSATTTGTELNYVSGVTSAIQTQLDGKQATALTTAGDIFYHNGTSVTRLPVGSDNQMLRVDTGLAGKINWETVSSSTTYSNPDSGANSEIFGLNANSNGADGTAYGNGANASTSTTAINNTCIGSASTCGAEGAFDDQTCTGYSSLCEGNKATAYGSDSHAGTEGVSIGAGTLGSTNSITIGTGTSTSGASNSICIGYAKTCSVASTTSLGGSVAASAGTALGKNANIGTGSTNSTVVGADADCGTSTNCTMVGVNALSNNNNHCMAFGRLAQCLTDREFVIGGTGTLIEDTYFGGTAASTAANQTIWGQPEEGTDQAGHSFTVVPGLATGNATSGGFFVKTGDVGASGTTIATPTTKLGVTAAGILQLTPIGTAPATCAIGDVYIDSSGAACFCTSANTWTNVTPLTGSCA